MSDEYDGAGEALYTEADVQAAAELARAQASEVYRVALRVGALGGLSADVVLKALEPAPMPAAQPADDSEGEYTTDEIVAAALELADSDEHPAGALEALAEKLHVGKAWDESKHKRDHGKFSSTGGSGAGSDAKTAGGNKPGKRALKAQKRAEAVQAASALMAQRAKGKPLSHGEAKELLDHMAHLTHDDLRALRKEHGSTFRGERVKGSRVDALVKWARGEDYTRRRGKRGSALQQVVDYGGLDPNSADFKRFYGSMRDAVNDGVPMAAFKRGGQGLDELAAEMVAAGHISIPDWEDPAEHLIGLLRGRKLLHHAADEGHEGRYAEHVAGQLEGDDGGAKFDPNKQWDDEDPDWFSKAAPLPDDDTHTPAELLAAAVDVAQRALADGTDPEDGLHALYELAHGDTVQKAWDKDKHPRDDHGRFVSKDAIQAAKSDPKKAAELKKRVTNPEQRKKLDAALEDKEVIGTKRGLAKHETAQKREKVQADRNRARELRIKLADQESRGEELNPDDLREIVPHLATMTHEELSRMRSMLERSGATFGGKRLRADRVAALTQWALDKAAGKTDTPAPEGKPEAESGSGAGESQPARTGSVADILRDVRGTMQITQPRAKPGGEEGPNGEWYPAGAFIATQDLPKRLKDKLKRQATGRVRVRNGLEVPQPGQMSIADKLGGTVMNPRDGSINEQYLDYIKASAEDRQMYAELAEKYKAGGDWVSVNDYPSLARLEDAARLLAAGKPVPGAVLAVLPAEYRERLQKWTPPTLEVKPEAESGSGAGGSGIDSGLYDSKNAANSSVSAQKQSSNADESSGGYTTPAEALINGVPYNKWHEAVFNAAYSEEDGSVKDPKAVELLRSVNEQQYRRHLEVVGRPVVVNHREIGAVEGFTDDLMGARVRMADGSVRLLSPDSLWSVGGTVRHELEKGRHARIHPEVLNHFAGRIADEMLSTGANLSDTLRKHNIDPAKAMSIRGPIAEEYERRKEAQKPQPSEALQRARERAKQLEDAPQKEIDPLHEEDVQRGRDADKKFRGEGRYEAETWQKLRRKNPDARLPKLSKDAAEWIADDYDRDGKPVPAEVLADYPDLAAKYAKPDTGTNAEPEPAADVKPEAEFDQQVKEWGGLPNLSPEKMDEFRKQYSAAAEKHGANGTDDPLASGAAKGKILVDAMRANAESTASAKPDTGTSAAPAPAADQGKPEAGSGSGAAADTSKPPRTRLGKIAAERAAQPAPDPNAEYETPRAQYLAFQAFAHPLDASKKPDAATVAEYLSKLPDGAREKLDKHFTTAGRSLAQVEAFHRARMAEATPEPTPRATSEQPAPVPAGGRGAATPADPQAELAKIPPGARHAVEWALAGLQEHADKLAGARNLDSQFRGNGRYEREVNDKGKEFVAARLARLAQFRELAAKNGVDADAVIAALGGIPNHEPSPTGANYRFADEPDAAPRAEQSPQVKPASGTNAGRTPELSDQELSYRKQEQDALDGDPEALRSIIRSHQDYATRLRGGYGDHTPDERERKIRHHEAMADSFQRDLEGEEFKVRENKAKIEADILDHLDDNSGFHTAHDIGRGIGLTRGHVRSMLESLAREGAIYRTSDPHTMEVRYSSEPPPSPKKRTPKPKPEPVPGGAPKAPDVSALKRNPRADLDHIERLKGQYPEGAIEREWLDVAKGNAAGVATRDNSALAALHGGDKQHGARHYVLERLASAAAQAHKDGDAAGHTATTNAVTGLGGTLHGAAPGETIAHDPAMYDHPEGAFSGDAVKVTRQPVTYRGALVYRGQVEPVGTGTQPPTNGSGTGAGVAAKPAPNAAPVPAVAIGANPVSEPTTPVAAAAEPQPGDTPRAVAKRVTEAAKDDYAFARASAVGNAGEDLKGSARHTRNQWRGLEEAEKNGTAAALVTRDSLLKNEPHALSSTVEAPTSLAHLAAHLALSAFPAKPGEYSGGRFTNNFRTPSSPEELRKQYVEAYQAVKAEAERAAAEETDPKQVAKRIQKLTKNIIDKLRDGNGGDRYNPVANALVDLNKKTAVSMFPKATHVIGRVNDFAKRLKEKYPNASVSELLQHAHGHVADVLEGDSFNKTFGTVAGPARFDPSAAYVSNAERKGGRMIDAATVEAGKAHMMNNVGLRGLQWGNSVTDDERQHHLTKSAEAFADLADATGLPDSAISLGGKLGLAIGARGKGGARAHYEQGEQVINLTRAKGVGSLAHEWGHALDHFLTGFGADEKDGGLLSEKVHETIKTREGPIADAMQAVAQAMTASGFRKRLSAEISQHIRDGKLPATAHSYWANPKEMFARTFERFVQHKLHSEGRENTYLTGLHKVTHPLWPDAKEMETLAPAMDKLMGAIRDKHFTGTTAATDIDAGTRAANTTPTQAGGASVNATSGPHKPTERQVQRVIKNAEFFREQAGKKQAQHELRFVPLSQIRPTQFGDDYDNNSSRELARATANGKRSDRERDHDPVLLDEEGNILDGNHRHAAATMNGAPGLWAMVPQDSPLGK